MWNKFQYAKLRFIVIHGKISDIQQVDDVKNGFFIQTFYMNFYFHISTSNLKELNGCCLFFLYSLNEGWTVF